MIFQKYIHRFQEEHWHEFQSFVKKCFHSKYILSNKAFFDWQYTTPFSGNKSALLVVNVRDNIAGFLGVIPLTMSYFGKDVRGACLANLMLDESLRNKGLGVDFVKVSYKETDLVYTVKYNADMARIYGHLNWHRDFLLRRFVRVLNVGKTAQLVKKTNATFPLSCEAIQRKTDKKLILESVIHFDKSVDDFWNRIREKYPITVSRTRAYLNWRYADHPVFSYKMFLVKKQDKVIGFFVVRIEDAHGFDPGYRVAHLVDFMAEDEVEEYMLAKLISFASENKVDLVDFAFSGNFHINALHKAGFVETLKEPYSLIPVLLNPVSWKYTEVNFAFTPSRADIFDKRLEDSTNWYITRGDGDHDRPNPH